MPLPLRDSSGRFIPKTKTPVKVLSQDLEYCLVLKSVNKDMTSHYDDTFKYPKKGMVRDPNWAPTRGCGNGLHGYLWGEGDGGHSFWIGGTKWLVLKVLKSDIINFGDKVKFPKGEVIYAGGRKGATDLILAHPEGKDKNVIGCYQIVEDGKSAVGGYRSTLVGGNKSNLTGGEKSKLTGGDYSTLVGDWYSTLTSGYESNIKGGPGSIIEGREGSILSGGNDSSLTWVIFTSTIGYVYHTVYVGKDGIKPNTKYRLKDGKPVKVGR